MRMLMLSYWDFQSKGMQVIYRTPIFFAQQGVRITFVVHSEMTNGPTALEDIHPNIDVRRYDIPLKFLCRAHKLCRLRQLVLFGVYCFRQALNLKRRSEKPDVIYAAECDAILIGRLLAWTFRIPLVSRYYGVSELLLKHPFRHLLYSAAIRVPADLSVVTDDGTHGKSHLTERNRHIKLLKFWRNGIDQAVSDPDNVRSIRERFGIARNDIVLMTVGRLYGWKRVDRAILTLRELRRQGQLNAKLLVVGQGPEEQRLKELTTSWDLGEQVIFVGPIPHISIYDFYALARFVLSLHEIANLGNAAWECINAEKCLVSIDQGGTDAHFVSGGKRDHWPSCRG